MGRERDKAQQSQKRIAEAYGQLQQQLVQSNQRVQSLIGHNDHLAGQLAAAHGDLARDVMFRLASRDSPQAQSNLQNAQAEIQELKRKVWSLETKLSSTTNRLPATAVQKALPASSAETSLALANRNIETLTSERQRLNRELMEAKELAGQWEENCRQWAQRCAELEDGIGEQRRIVRESTLSEETESEKPGFFSRALTALGLLGTGAVLGMGAAAALGREDSPQTLVAAPVRNVLAPAAEQKALGSAPAQKALGPATQRLLPPKSES